MNSSNNQISFASLIGIKDKRVIEDFHKIEVAFLLYCHAYRRIGKFPDAPRKAQDAHKQFALAIESFIQQIQLLHTSDINPLIYFINHLQNVSTSRQLFEKLFNFRLAEILNLQQTTAQKVECLVQNLTDFYNLAKSEPEKYPGFSNLVPDGLEIKMGENVLQIQKENFKPQVTYPFPGHQIILNTTPLYLPHTVSNLPPNWTTTTTTTSSNQLDFSTNPTYDLSKNTSVTSHSLSLPSRPQTNKRAITESLFKKPVNFSKKSKSMISSETTTSQTEASYTYPVTLFDDAKIKYHLSQSYYIISPDEVQKLYSDTKLVNAADHVSTSSLDKFIIIPKEAIKGVYQKEAHSPYEFLISEEVFKDCIDNQTLYLIDYAELQGTAAIDSSLGLYLIEKGKIVIESKDGIVKPNIDVDLSHQLFKKPPSNVMC